MVRKVIAKGRQESLRVEQSVSVCGNQKTETRRVVREQKEVVIETDTEGHSEQTIATLRVEDIFSQLSNLSSLESTNTNVFIDFDEEDEGDDDFDEEYDYEDGECDEWEDDDES